MVLLDKSVPTSSKYLTKTLRIINLCEGILHALTCFLMLRFQIFIVTISCPKFEVLVRTLFRKWVGSSKFYKEQGYSRDPLPLISSLFNSS